MQPNHVTNQDYDATSQVQGLFSCFHQISAIYSCAQPIFCYPVCHVSPLFPDAHTSIDTVEPMIRSQLREIGGL